MRIVEMHDDRVAIEYLVDGYEVARRFAETHPDAYALLAAVEFPWRFQDATTDIGSHAPVLDLDVHPIDRRSTPSGLLHGPRRHHWQAPGARAEGHRFPILLSCTGSTLALPHPFHAFVASACGYEGGGKG